jgi:Astacin (Peptidase family M12A)
LAIHVTSLVFGIRQSGRRHRRAKSLPSHMTNACLMGVIWGRVIAVSTSRYEAGGASMYEAQEPSQVAADVPSMYEVGEPSIYEPSIYEVGGPRTQAPAASEEGSVSESLPAQGSLPDTSEERAPDDESCWWRSSSETGIAYISGTTFDGKALEYAVVDGMAIFEGDIALGPAQSFQAAAAPASLEDVQSGVAIVGNQFRWPGGIVPWRAQSALRPLVLSAIQHWQANTNIRFTEVTAQNQQNFPNHLSFEAQDGCWSQVGMRGGRQIVSLGTGCGFGAAVHEIGHAVGLWHEQSREDRDRYIRVQWEHIQSGREHNFNQHVSDGDDVGLYDFGSIMHYPSTAFSKDGQPTIVALGGQAIGQRTGLSQGDIAAVRAMYAGATRRRAWGDPSAYYTPLFDAARVVYRGHDDHIHELWLTKDSGGWQHADLSAMTGAPGADRDLLGFFNAAPFGYYTSLYDAARVIYRGQDEHIHELWLTQNSGGWQHADLSAMASAPAAASEPYGYHTPLYDAARVIYRGHDDHIHELWLTQNSGGWQHADLTNLGGLPMPGTPFGYFSEFDSTARVVYRGYDDHIRELSLSAAHPWMHEDLTPFAQ